ncbi:hypothetical protein [Streptomyces sp. R-74717]|uniref:hypothetical protein n=1 Tax=Streptomyces sp. R-74717 TaxID=2969820 RepID=UPI0039B4AADF
MPDRARGFRLVLRQAGKDRWEVDPSEQVRDIGGLRRGQDSGSRGGSRSVQAGDGKPIHAKPFGALQEHRLIRIDTRTSAVAGQEVKVTAAGKLMLDIQKPSRTQAASPGKVLAPGNAGGRRR